MDLRCELCKNKCCIYLPEVPQTERKGSKDRRKSARRPGLRIMCPKEIYSVLMQEFAGFYKTGVDVRY